MPATAAPVTLPTRSTIQDWDTAHLDDAAVRWRASAAKSEAFFERHRQNIVAPGGTEWTGDAKDAALDRVTADQAVVRAQGDRQRQAAAIAEQGVGDVQAAKREALQAIADAEAAGFRVADDLSVRDTQRVDLSTAAARHVAAREHAEDVRWYADRLLQTDTHVNERLHAKAAELTGIRFEGEGSDTSVQLLDNDDRESPKDEAVERAAEPRNPVPEPGTWPPPATPIEGGTPGGEPYPNGLGEPVPGTELPSKPQPPKWEPVDPGAGPFKSWEPRNPGDALSKQTVAAGIWWKNDEIPHAARNLEHYLGVTGTPLEQDVSQMLSDIPAFQSRVDTETQRLAAEAVNRAQASGATGPSTFPVNTDWDGVAARQGSSGAEYDWFLASGNFDYHLTGQVTVHPPAEPGAQWTYALDTDVNIRDRYNWDIGKQTPIMGTPITDAQMARLHLIGYAQEFTMVGSTGIHRVG